MTGWSATQANVQGCGICQDYLQELLTFHSPAATSRKGSLLLAFFLLIGIRFATLTSAGGVHVPLLQAASAASDRRPA
jgi:hypothetical protein